MSESESWSRSWFSNKTRRIIFTCYNLIAGATWKFSTSMLFAFIDRLVNTTEQVIFVLLDILSIAIIASRLVSLLRRCRRFIINFFLHLHLHLGLFHLINNMTCLHSSFSNSLHLLNRNRWSCYLFNRIHSYKFIASH